MTELEKKKMFNKMVGDYIKQEVSYIDDATDDVKDKVVWKAPEKGKKIPQNYICAKCGRIKTVRFKSNPTPTSVGKCPRCKEGTMYSEIVYEQYKNTIVNPIVESLDKKTKEIALFLKKFQ